MHYFGNEACMIPYYTNLTMVKAVIVDDDSISRMVLKEILRKTVGNIEMLGEASSVVEGVILIERENPDVVFWISVCPTGTGFDLLDRLKKLISR